MSISFMREVLKIADRFSDRKDPDAVDRQGHLNQVLVVVVIFHAIMGISFIKMEEYEHKHPRVIRDVDVSFEFSVPPAAPEIKVSTVPRALALTMGEDPDDSGSAEAARAKNDKTTTISSIQAKQTREEQSDASRQVISHETTVDVPVQVTKNTMTKASPAAMPKGSDRNSKDSDVMVSNNTNNQVSGMDVAGGVANGQNSAGTGGTGIGGTGQSDGANGAGSGNGSVVGMEPITTRLQQSGRAMFNIAPYRKAALMKIASIWRPKKKVEVTIMFSIARDGTVINAEIFEKSGNAKLDADALAAIESIEFAPLPDEIKDESLPFKIDLAGLSMTKD